MDNDTFNFDFGLQGEPITSKAVPSHQILCIINTLLPVNHLFA